MIAPASFVAAKRPLRIVFVLNALAMGGAEIHTVELARALADRGHDSLLVALLDREQIGRRGLKAEVVGDNRLFNLSTHNRLAESLERYEPDIVVAINGRPAACAQLAHFVGGAKRRPVATIYHTSRLLDFRQQLQHAVHLPFINQSDALVFVSENQQAYCTRRLMRGRRVLTIHNGVDGARFNLAARTLHRETMRASLGFGPDEYVIGQSAAFRPEKNHTQSLQALAALHQRGVPARLLLVGDGQGRAQIEALAATLGLDNAILFAGRQGDVVPWLSAFDVGILTSTTETFSLAALEFMAIGVPAILSDIGGASEMVSHGSNGHVFPANDTPALVKSLVALFDPVLRKRMGDAAAVRVAGSFTHEKMVIGYEQLFLQLTGRC
jgi:glycosyltransferase involved in cell wall biosynthesis